MQDKYGVEINVGDIVELTYLDGTTTEGKVTVVNRDDLWAMWDDTRCKQLVNKSNSIRLVKPAASIPAEQTVGFTQEDEAMLQMLLKRKKDHEAERSSIVHQFQLMVNCIHDQVTYADALAYLKVKSNAEQVIRSIKAFHEIN